MNERRLRFLCLRSALSIGSFLAGAFFGGKTGISQWLDFWTLKKEQTVAQNYVFFHIGNDSRRKNGWQFCWVNSCSIWSVENLEIDVFPIFHQKMRLLGMTHTKNVVRRCLLLRCSIPHDQHVVQHQHYRDCLHAEALPDVRAECDYTSRCVFTTRRDKRTNHERSQFICCAASFMCRLSRLMPCASWSENSRFLTAVLNESVFFRFSFSRNFEVAIASSALREGCGDIVHHVDLIRLMTFSHSVFSSLLRFPSFGKARKTTSFRICLSPFLAGTILAEIWKSGGLEKLKLSRRHPRAEIDPKDV